MPDQAPNLQPDPHGTATPPEANARPGALQTIGQTITGLSALMIFALIATPVVLAVACIAIMFMCR